MKLVFYAVPFLLFARVVGAADSTNALPPITNSIILSGIAAIANDGLVTIQEAMMLARTVGPIRDPALWTKAVHDASEHLIERQLILDDFKSSGLVFPESLIEDQIQDIIREKFGDRRELAKTLQAQGKTIEAFRQQQREDLILKAMEQRNVKQAIIISPAKIEAYYQTNVMRYKLDDQARLRGIVLKRGAISSCEETRKLAQEILTKIEQGASFSDMASIYNDPPRKDGGDWGWFEISKLSAGFADVAASLDSGKHSGVFSKTREEDNSYWVYFYDATGKISRGRKYAIKDGKETFVEENAFANVTGHEGLPALPVEFYLLLVEEKKVAHTRPIAELRDEIEKDLIAQERARLRSKWVERLKAKSFVRRF